MKILHITNLNERFEGRLHYNTGKRINNGFIRLGHNVLTLSDRDILNTSKANLQIDEIANMQVIGSVVTMVVVAVVGAVVERRRGNELTDGTARKRQETDR